jgi:tetratricopeptide (TPR) repeat protein|tara:strand:+ start:7413 stop:9062 length:1650 start_codon:yes stop_codon:yes gene_type:complete
LVVVLFAFGCKSSSVGVAKVNDLDYKTRKAFEKSFFEANKQKVLNNSEKARELFSLSLTLNPKSHATMYQLAKLNYQLDRYTEALVFAEKAVRTSPRYNHWYSGLLAQYYSKFGKYQKSAEMFIQMTENEPDVKENYTESANQYYNAKQLEKSVEVLKRMQSHFGIEKVSSTRLDFVFSALGDKEKAVLEMEKLVAAYPDDIQFKGYLSETYLKAGKKEKAVALLERIVEEDPSVGKAHYALYSIKRDGGKYMEAMSHLKEAFKYDDLSLLQKMQAVTVFLNDFKKDSSLKADLFDFSEILASNYPNFIEPYIFKSDIYGTMGQYDSARYYTRKALSIDPSEFQLWSKLLGANALLNDVDQQIEDTEEALTLFPNVIALYVSLSYAYLEKEDYTTGIKIADEGLDVAVDKRDKIQLLLCKASAFDKQEMYQAADKNFDKVLKMNPFNATVLNNYAFSLANRKIKLEKADSMITTALRLEPSNPFYLDTKAWILYGKEEFEQALKILNKCMQLDPKGKEYYTHAIACYVALENTNMANEMQQKLDKLKNE